MSAPTVAGPPHQGKLGGEVRRHRSHPKGLCLSTQTVRISKPRLRREGGGKQAEVAIPAYEAMHSNASLSEKLSSIPLRRVSTRYYRDVIPQRAETCGVSKSSVSREFIESSAEQF